MASINGVEIRRMESTRGEDGFSGVKGYIFLNGEKLGLWELDYPDGPEFYRFDKNLLNDPVYAFSGGAQGIDIPQKVFLEKIISVNKDEEAFKKLIDSEYDVMILVKKSIHCGYIACKHSAELSDDEIKERYSKEIEHTALKLSGSCFERPKKDVAISIFRDLSDFDFIVDSKHPATEYLLQEQIYRYCCLWC